jgi:hypothetical protein
VRSTRKIAGEARYPLPECDVPPHESAEIYTSLPATTGPFLPTWFLLPEVAARCLVINDVKVGKNSQFANVTCVPASLFANSPDKYRLRMDRLSRGMELRVSVTNTSDRPVRFSGQVLGTHADAVVTTRDLMLCGLGLSLVEGARFDLRVQSSFDLSPRRLYVPDHVLEHLAVESVEIRPYSHGSKTSAGVYPSDGGPVFTSVPPRMLSLENLRGGGEIRLDPVPSIGISSWICLKIVNRLKKPRWWSGAVLG